MSNTELKTVAADTKKSDVDLDPAAAAANETAAVGDKGNTLNEEEFSEDLYDPFCDQTLGPLTARGNVNARKMTAQVMMDSALLMANFTQIRTLTSSGFIEYKTLMIVLVSCSISFQLMFAFIIIFIWARENERKNKGEYLASLREITDARESADNVVKSAVRQKQKRHMIFSRYSLSFYVDNSTIFLLYLISTLNMVISVFGIELEPFAV